MRSHKNLPELSLDSLDVLIRSALQEDVSPFKVPCAWRQIKKRVWRLEREKQTGIYQGVNYAEAIFLHSSGIDMSYFLITNSILQTIR